MEGLHQGGFITWCKFLRSRANERKPRPQVGETDTTSHQTPRENRFNVLTRVFIAHSSENADS